MHRCIELADTQPLFARVPLLIEHVDGDHSLVVVGAMRMRRVEHIIKAYGLDRHRTS